MSIIHSFKYIFVDIAMLYMQYSSLKLQVCSFPNPILFDETKDCVGEMGWNGGAEKQLL